MTWRALLAAFLAKLLSDFGPSGEPGPAGPAGPQGAPGAPGPPGASGGSPAGDDKAVQFNDGGTLAGDAGGFGYDRASQTATVKALTVRETLVVDGRVCLDTFTGPGQLTDQLVNTIPIYSNGGVLLGVVPVYNAAG